MHPSLIPSRTVKINPSLMPGKHATNTSKTMATKPISTSSTANATTSSNRTSTNMTSGSNVYFPTVTDATPPNKKYKTVRTIYAPVWPQVILTSLHSSGTSWWQTQTSPLNYFACTSYNQNYLHMPASTETLVLIKSCLTHQVPNSLCTKTLTNVAPSATYRMPSRYL